LEQVFMSQKEALARVPPLGGKDIINFW